MDLSSVTGVYMGIPEGADVILGLNEDESIQVANVLFGSEVDDLSAGAQKIRTELGLFQVVVHPTRSATEVSAEGEWFVEGERKPEIQAGSSSK